MPIENYVRPFVRHPDSASQWLQTSLAGVVSDVDPFILAEVSDIFASMVDRCALRPDSCPDGRIFLETDHDRRRLTSSPPGWRGVSFTSF
jgi:hypothetical protein